MGVSIKKKFLDAVYLEINSLTYLFTGVLSLFYFLAIAALNPDPHHDGVQFAAAAGVADGLKIHSEVYEQYGPVSAWIQGATLKLFGPTLLNLRLENAVLLTLAAVLLVRIFLVLRLPPFIAILTAVVWAISCPVSAVYPGAFGFWPWSSVFALVLLLDNAAVLLRVQVRKRNLSTWEMTFAGVTCGVLVFTRFQVGVAASIVNLILIYLGAPNKQSALRGVRARKFLLALALSVLYFVGVLAKQGSLTSFVDQIIVGPLHQYVHPFDWNFFKIYYVLGSLPILILILLAVFAIKLNSLTLRILSLLILAGAIGFFMYCGNWGNDAYLNKFPTWQALLDVQGISMMFTSVIVFLVLCFLAICYVFSIDFLYPALFHKSYTGENLRLIYRFVMGKEARTHANVSSVQSARRANLATPATLLVLLLPFFVQLYPIADVYHLWWVAPLFMVLIPYFLANFVSRQSLNAIMAAALVPALIASSVMFVNLIQVPRSEIQVGALKGMQIEAQYILSYNAVNETLMSVSPSSSRFYCPDGLLASWNGSYNSIDASYVSWAWVVKNPPTTSIPVRYFVCGTQDSANAIAAANGLRVIGPGIPYRLSYWSAGVLFELAR